MWLGDAAILGRERRCFAVDIPGEPGMSGDRRLEWRPEACVSWLAEVIAALGLDEHCLLGLSYGDRTPPEKAIRIGTLLAESTKMRMETLRLYSDDELARIRAPIFLGVGTKDVLLKSR